MIDIFISYAHNDKAVAERLAKHLDESGLDIYWDRHIEAGAEWNEDIQKALQKARCVIVLWSRTSRGSFWVQGEAAYSYKREVYLPVLIEDTDLPRLFRHVQTPSIALFAGQKEGGAEELAQLMKAIKSRIGEMPMYGNLEKVADGEPVTNKHLNIIHSCWRVDKESAFGLMPYQIHLIIYGHWSALKRVKSVEYNLPGYPKGHERQTRDERSKLFELKELANGFSIVQANVHLENQPRPFPPILTLSRFINMSESGPKLLDDFIHRSKAYRKE